MRHHIYYADVYTEYFTYEDVVIVDSGFGKKIMCFGHERLKLPLEACVVYKETIVRIPDDLF